jgi:hypothetical protein
MPCEQQHIPAHIHTYTALPRYSSKGVLKDKLLYAIRNADLMDADFLVREAVGWEGVG